VRAFVMMCLFASVVGSSRSCACVGCHRARVLLSTYFLCALPSFLVARGRLLHIDITLHWAAWLWATSAPSKHTPACFLQQWCALW